MKVNKIKYEDFCLSKTEVDKLKSVNFEKIKNKDFKERLNVFTEILGEERGGLFNIYADKQLFLKKQQEGLLKWVNKTKIKPKWRKEIIRRISKMEKSLNDKDLDSFMEELASLKLGLGVTEEEAITIMKLSQRIEEARVKMDKGGSRTDYENATSSLEEYKNKIIKES